jgi:hypothetical protein
MSVYYNVTERITTPELLKNAVYTTQEDYKKGEDNQLISAHLYGFAEDPQVEVSRRPTNTLPFDQQNLTVDDLDKGSAYSLRKVVTTPPEKTVLSTTDGKVLGQIPDNYKTGYSHTEIDLEDTDGFSVRDFASWSGQGDNHFIDWIEEDGKRIGFKIGTEIADNGYTVDTASVSINAEGTEVTVSNIDDIFDTLFTEHTVEYNTMTTEQRLAYGVAFQFMKDSRLHYYSNGGGLYQRRYLPKYVRGGVTYSDGRYEVDTVNKTVKILTEHFHESAELQAGITNVRIKIGVQAGHILRFRGAKPGRTYNVSGEFRLLEAGLDTEWSDQRAAIDFSDNNDEDEPFTAYRTLFMDQQSINRDVLVHLNASNANDGHPIDLRFKYSGEITKRYDKNGAEQVRDPVYKTNDGQFPYYQLYSDGNARWKIIYRPNSDTSNDVSICHQASTYFSNSTDGVSITRTPADFPTKLNSNGEDYWTRATTNGVYNTLHNIEISLAPLEGNAFEKFSFNSTFNVTDDDLADDFDTSNNPSASYGWWDFSVIDNGFSSRGRMVAEYKNIVITEQPNVALTVRRSTDNCHVDIMFDDNDEVSLDSPVKQTMLQEYRTSDTRQYHHIDGIQNDDSFLFNDNPKTQATTLREFIDERVIYQQTPTLLSTPYAQSQNVKYINFSETERGFSIKTKDTFTSGGSGDTADAVRVNIPLNQYIDEYNAYTTKFKVTFRLAEIKTTGATDYLQVSPVNTLTSAYGRWTSRNKKNETVNEVYRTTGTYTQEFYSMADVNSDLHVGGIVFIARPGQTIRVEDIHIEAEPSLHVVVWHDQVVSYATNAGKNKVRNAKELNYRQQPMLVDSGELVTLKGKPAIKFQSRIIQDATGSFNDTHYSSLLRMGNVLTQNDKASAFLVAARTPNPETGNTHANTDFWFTFGATGTNGATSTTFGIGYNETNLLALSASSYIMNSGDPGAYTRSLSDVTNGGIITVVGGTSKTRSYVNGRKVGEIDTPTNAAGNHDITQNIGRMGGHGTGQNVEDGLIQELLLFRKDLGFMRPHIEANISSHWREGATPNILTRYKSDNGQNYHCSLKINHVPYKQSTQGTVKLKYFVPKDSPFVGKHIHIGDGAYPNNLTPAKYYSKEGSEALAEETWVEVVLSYGEQFGGNKKPQGFAAFMFITDSKDNTGSVVTSTGSAEGDEIVFADIEIVSLDEDQNLSTTGSGYTKPTYKSGL